MCVTLKVKINPTKRIVFSVEIYLHSRVYVRDDLGPEWRRVALKRGPAVLIR